MARLLAVFLHMSRKMHICELFLDTDLIFTFLIENLFCRFHVVILLVVCCLFSLFVLCIMYDQVSTTLFIRINTFTCQSLALKSS